MRQRVVIAMAIANDLKVIIADGAKAPLVPIAGQPSLRNPGATTVDYPPVD